MDRVLIMMEREDTGRELAHWFEGSFQVAIRPARPDALDSEFDLAVVDDPVRERLEAPIQWRRRDAAPVLLPVLLVTSPSHLPECARHLGNSVDDLILAPVEKTELLVRAAALVSARRRSLEHAGRSDTWLTAVSTLARRVVRSQQLEEVIDEALNSILEIAQPTVVVIFQCRNESLHPLGSRAIDDQYRHDDMLVHRVGECLCGLAAEKAEPAYSADILSDPRCTWKECRQAGLKSFVALPLLVRREVIGVLGLGDLSHRDFRIQAPFLETVAATVTLSIQNALYAEQSREYSKNLEKIVAERTTQLKEKNQELERANSELRDANTMLERMNKLFVGRELRIKNLKEELERLRNRGIS